MCSKRKHSFSSALTYTLYDYIFLEYSLCIISCQTKVFLFPLVSLLLFCANVIHFFSSFLFSLLDIIVIWLKDISHMNTVERSLIHCLLYTERLKSVLLSFSCFFFLVFYLLVLVFSQRYLMSLTLY